MPIILFYCSQWCEEKVYEPEHKDGLCKDYSLLLEGYNFDRESAMFDGKTDAEVKTWLMSILQTDDATAICSFVR